MKLSARLSVNNRKVISLTLHPDRRRVSNEFNTRAWIPRLTLADSDRITVTVNDEMRSLATLELMPKTTNGKRILTGANDDGHLYVWSNLTPGYSQTFGLTVGVMFRKKAGASYDVPAAEIFDMGAGI